ncbi:hypothetical protein AB833_21180 [Chromatiales bacterium (ex Bugula neritina AB1)]|nr:hypothetical protein AB833_21180 [Chromatiales bacterium (ex Bugula neritina AB1)]
MIDRDAWQEVIQALTSNRLRTLLTASGIFWGIFILIVMLGFGNGIEGGVKRSMKGYATNALYLWGSETSVPYQGLSPGRRIVLDNSDSTAILSEIEGVGHLAPRVRLGRYRSRRDVSYANKVTDAEVSGDLPGYENILPMAIETGRFLNPLDQARKRKVAVIGERVHAELFGEDVNPIGKQIQIRQISFTVVGIFKPAHYGDDRERMSSLVFTPLSTFQQVFNYGQDIGFYAMVPKPGYTSREVAEEVKALLRQRHRVAPGDARAIGDWNTESEFIRIRNLFTGIRAFIWTVGVATLLAGVLGVSNIMLIAIRERRREFGLRKSIGATPADVIRMIILETSALVSGAGILGLLGGLIALYVIDLFTRSITNDAGSDVLFSTPTVDLKIALAALFALVLASLLAAVIPARHAMRIDPVEALRVE